MKEVGDIVRRLEARGVRPSEFDVLDLIWVSGHLLTHEQRCAVEGVRENSAEASFGEGHSADAAISPEKPAFRDSGGADTSGRDWTSAVEERQSIPEDQGYGGAPQEDEIGAGVIDDGAPDGTAGGSRIRIAGARPFAERFESLIQALRPLRLSRLEPTGLIDGNLTVEGYAATGFILPCWEVRKRSALSISLVIEASPSVLFWSAWIDEWIRLLRAGTHAPVERLYLEPVVDGPAGEDDLAFTVSPRCGSSGSRAESLLKGNRRRQILLFTDLASPYWQSGHLPQLVETWAERIPVTLVTPLPEDVLLRTCYLAAPERGQARCRDLSKPARWCRAGERLPEMPPVFLLRLEQERIRNWASALSGRARSGHLAIGWKESPVAWPAASRPSVEAPAPLRIQELAERVRLAEEELLSPAALALIRVLAAAPLTPGIMRLVQEAIYPQQSHEALAEVLFSGLIFRLPGQGLVDPDRIHYDFLKTDISTDPERLRDRLFREAEWVKIEEIQLRVGDYLSTHIGLDAHAIEAVIMGTEQDGLQDLPHDVRIFARGIGHVWKHFAGPRGQSGRRILRKLGEGADEPQALARSADWISRDFDVPLGPGMKMLCIGRGDFVRGERSEAHQVTVSEDFYIAETPITQAQYRALTGLNPSFSTKVDPDAPVETVNWEEAAAFCARLTLIAAPEEGWIWSLPTEAQWEYACRAGTSTGYSWGDAFVEGRANVENDEGTTADKQVTYFRSRGLPVKSTMPVKTFEPNPWGLYDCHGNVWEWCADWYGEYRKEVFADPHGPETGAERVLRGGSWSSDVQDCRSSSRSGAAPVPGIYYTGFRPVLTRKNPDEGGTAPSVATRGAEKTAKAESRRADYVTADFPNSLGMKMICLARGTFVMGSPVSEDGRESESWTGKETQHMVTLTEAFWISKTLMTQGAWRTLMGTTVQEQVAKGNTFGEVSGIGDEHPIYSVNWDEALSACDRLSIRERDAGCLPDGYLYTLPTEAQWEYACRAGTEGPLNVDGAALSDLGWFGTNGGSSTHPVGTKEANAWGIVDCHGNVWEWCADLYQADLGAEAVLNPKSLDAGSRRVLRGAAWSIDAQYGRSASRYGIPPEDRMNDTGFRPVLSPRQHRMALDVLPAQLEVVMPAQPQALTQAEQFRPVFVPIQPGKFGMGSPRQEKDRANDETWHEVILTRPFEIADAPLTQAQYEAVMGSNPSYGKDSGSDAPVEQVSWDNAKEWCRKMSERDPDHTYRLPTEAEWEYSCRAGTVTPFHFGIKLNGIEANCDGRHSYGSGQKGPYLERTSPVRSYAANPWGLYDCHGNVWEWCEDWYQSSLGSKPVKDPKGPVSGGIRVLRGGSWSRYARYCRSASRFGFDPADRDINIGFRPVRIKRSEIPELEPGAAQPAPAPEVRRGSRLPRWLGGGRR